MNSDFIRTLPGETFAEQLDYYGRHVLPSLSKVPHPVTLPKRHNQRDSIRGIVGLSSLLGAAVGLSMMARRIKKNKNRKRLRQNK